MAESQDIRMFRLDNGLRVLVKQMQTAPMVSVWISYRVGSRFERPGITGISHWVEHMLFKGTPTLAKGEVFKSVHRVGGNCNGFTSEDQTVYLENLPVEHWELGLRIESDRMVNSLFDPDEVASERTVIISEREGAENHPHMRLVEEVRGAAYRVHPYRWGVLGYKCDLQRITRDDLYDYYRRFYAPDNAALVLVGDLDADEAHEGVKRFFADIPPSGDSHEVRSVEPEQVGERRVEVRRPGSSVCWLCAHHIPEYSHADRLPLLVLEAVLSGARPLSWGAGVSLGASARLHQSLVEKKQLAVGASGHARLMKDPGQFILSMLLRDGVKPEKAEKAMFAEIEKLKDKGPRDAEMKKALRQVQAQVEYARDGISANAYMIVCHDMLGDLDELEDLEQRVAAVTADDVIRVARKYLARQNRTVGVFVPDKPGAAGGADAETGPQEYIAPAAGRAAGYAFYVRGSAGAPASGSARAWTPVIREKKLDCGVRVLAVENAESHCQAMSGFIRGGAALDPEGLEGLSHLTQRLLLQGTRRKNYRQLAEATDRIGATLHFGNSAEATGLGAKSLPRDLTRVLKLARECLSEMTAPEAELEKERRRTITGLKLEQDIPNRRARRTAKELLYPKEHPYHRDARGEPESLERIERQDVLDFAARNYGAPNATLAFAGSLSFRDVCRAVEAAFGGWRTDVEAAPPAPEPLIEPASPGRKVVVMPGKSQCDLIVARIAVPRTHPDYVPVCITNSILGGFALGGRIGDHVRDKLGLAYYAFSSVAGSLHAGEWDVIAGVNPGNVARALDAVEQEIERICREPVSEEELNEVKQHILGSMPLSLETSDALCWFVRDIAFHDLPLDYLDRYREQVSAVDIETVQATARKYLEGKAPVVVIAGPDLPD